MLAGHFHRFNPELELFHTNGTVAIFGDMGGGDLKRRHRFHGSLRGRRVIEAASGEPVELDLGDLIEESFYARACQKPRHARRKGAKARPHPVVIVKFKASALRAICVAAPSAVGRTAEDDDRVEGGEASNTRAPVTAGSEVRESIREGSIPVEQVPASEPRRAPDIFEEAAIAVRADDRIVRPDSDEASAAVAPIGGCPKHRRRRRHQMQITDRATPEEEDETKAITIERGGGQKKKSEAVARIQDSTYAYKIDECSKHWSGTDVS